jgi:hypothetical protein
MVPMLETKQMEPQQAYGRKNQFFVSKIDEWLKINA